jgi:hypothetical protein
MEAAKKYKELVDKYGDLFLDWLDGRFKNDVNLFKFTASEEFALKIMNEFKLNQQ